jgi:hypothetical protein
MSKSLANSKILKRIPKRKKADPAEGDLEFQGAGKLSLKASPQKRSLFKPSANVGRGLLKKQASGQGDKTTKNKGKRASDRSDETY